MELKTEQAHSSRSAWLPRSEGLGSAPLTEPLACCVRWPEPAAADEHGAASPPAGQPHGDAQSQQAQGTCRSSSPAHMAQVAGERPVGAQSSESQRGRATRAQSSSLVATGAKLHIPLLIETSPFSHQKEPGSAGDT